MSFAPLSRPLIRSARSALPRPKSHTTRPSVDSIVGRTLGIGDEQSRAEHQAREVERQNDVARSRVEYDTQTAPRHEHVEHLSTTATSALGLSRGRRLPRDLSVKLSEQVGPTPEGLIVHDSHTDGEVANVLGARAFAIGNHLVFGRNEYHPRTPSGFSLLAHEAYHAAYPNPAAGLIQRSKKDISGAVQRGEPISKDDILAVHDAGPEDWFTLAMAVKTIATDRAQPPRVQKIANDVLQFMNYVDAVELRDDGDSILLDPRPSDLDEPDALITIRNYEVQNNFVDRNLGTGDLTLWEQLHFHQDRALPRPTPPAPTIEDMAPPPPVSPDYDNAELSTMSEMELDELIAQYSEYRKSSDPETAEDLDIIITQLEQMKIIVRGMRKTMRIDSKPGKVTLAHHIPLFVEVPRILTQEYAGMDMLPTSELVQHRFAIVAVDNSTMTVVHVGEPAADVETWIVLEYDVGTGTISAEMSVDAYEEQRARKVGEPGLQATLSPIDYTILGLIAGPAALRAVAMAGWRGVLRAKAVGMGVNVLAQGAGDYWATGELDGSNLIVAGVVGWTTPGLPGPNIIPKAGLVGVLGAASADLVNYEQGQSKTPMNPLNLALGAGSNIFGSKYKNPLFGGQATFGSTLAPPCGPSWSEIPQFDPLAATRFQNGAYGPRIRSLSAPVDSLSVSHTSPSSLMLDPRLRGVPIDPVSMILGQTGHGGNATYDGTPEASSSGPTLEPNEALELLNTLGRLSPSLIVSPSNDEQSATPSTNATSPSQAGQIKVCTKAILIEDEVKLTCGSEIIDISEVQIGAGSVR